MFFHTGEKLEEKLHTHKVDMDIGNTPSTSATPGKCMVGMISKSSHLEYTCYSMRDVNNEIVAVFIESKRTGQQNTRML